MSPEAIHEDAPVRGRRPARLHAAADALGRIRSTATQKNA